MVAPHAEGGARPGCGTWSSCFTETASMSLMAPSGHVILRSTVS